MFTLKELIADNDRDLIFDFPFSIDDSQIDRPIAYYGPCWYSLDSHGVYRAGKHATKSRIRILSPQHCRINGARSMLKEAAKQFRLNDDSGHAEMCEMHADLLLEA